MCGGYYSEWTTPKQLTIINGEPLIKRTIRQLEEHGCDVAISSNNPIFEQFDVPVLHHENNYIVTGHKTTGGLWVDAFYPMQEPVCYVFGDVVFTENAIKTIVETETDGIEFFASAPPFAKEYPKEWAEPFAFKVQDTGWFRYCIDTVRIRKNEFKRGPIAWELWQVIKGTPINRIDYTNYVVINDSTCDIDFPEEVR